MSHQQLLCVKQCMRHLAILAMHGRMSEWPVSLHLPIRSLSKCQIPRLQYLILASDAGGTTCRPRAAHQPCAAMRSAAQYTRRPPTSAVQQAGHDRSRPLRTQPPPDLKHLPSPRLSWSTPRRAVLCRSCMSHMHSAALRCCGCPGPHGCAAVLQNIQQFRNFQSVFKGSAPTILAALSSHAGPPRAKRKLCVVGGGGRERCWRSRPSGASYRAH